MQRYPGHAGCFFRHAACLDWSPGTLVARQVGRYPWEMRVVECVLVAMGTLSSCEAPLSVDHECVRLYRRRRVVQSVRVLGRLALQLTLIVQGPRSAITEKPAAQRDEESEC